MFFFQIDRSLIKWKINFKFKKKLFCSILLIHQSFHLQKSIICLPWFAIIKYLFRLFLREDIQKLVFLVVEPLKFGYPSPTPFSSSYFLFLCPPSPLWVVQPLKKHLFFCVSSLGVVRFYYCNFLDKTNFLVFTNTNKHKHKQTSKGWHIKEMTLTTKS